MQFLADGMTGMDTGIDHLIIMVLLLQITAEMNHSLSSFLSKNFPYGSGSGASGFWGNNQGTQNGYGGNGTGPRCAGLGLGGKNH